MRSHDREKDDNLRRFNDDNKDNRKMSSTSGRDRRMKRLLMTNNQETTVAQKGNNNNNYDNVDDSDDAVLDEVFEDLQQTVTKNNGNRDDIASPAPPVGNHSSGGDHAQMFGGCAYAANENKVVEAIEEAFGRGADLYGTVLKVPRDSYAEKLRKAYFYRALEFHVESQPADATANDLRKIAKKYRAVSLAYKILSNYECRRLYDEHGIITLQSHTYAALNMNEEMEMKSPRDLRKELLGEKTKKGVDGASPMEQTPSRTNKMNHKAAPEVGGKDAISDVISKAFGANCDLYKDVLRINRDATTEEIRKAYCLRAMFFHKGRQPATLSPDQVETASLRFRAVTVAYKVLANEALKAKYDETGILPISATRAVEKETEDRPVSDAIKDRKLKVAPPEVEKLFEDAFGEDADLYENVLRISKDSSAEVIRQGYLQRAMFFHPNRQAGKDLNERQLKKASLCFRAVAVAYKILSDPELKRKYDETGDIYELSDDNVTSAVDDSVTGKPEEESKAPLVAPPQSIPELESDVSSPANTPRRGPRAAQETPQRPIVTREPPPTPIPTMCDIFHSDHSKRPSITDFPAYFEFYTRNFDNIVEETIDDANRAVQSWLDDVGEIFAPELNGSFDDSLSVYTESVATESVGSLYDDDDFALEEFKDVASEAEQAVVNATR
mmetsp:Transcript_13950/g.20687  ORF Transcript_13950/g.20687 Transcript_13950/m.20687 type:complete len:670 (-) Transcript_13950:5869-7878(-)